jgi:hypothetical protein
MSLRRKWIVGVAIVVGLALAPIGCLIATRFLYETQYENGVVVEVKARVVCIDVGSGKDQCADLDDVYASPSVGDCVEIEIVHPNVISNVRQVPCS